jgi:hypothetical protein
VREMVAALFVSSLVGRREAKTDVPSAARTCGCWVPSAAGELGVPRTGHSAFLARDGETEWSATGKPTAPPTSS